MVVRVQVPPPPLVTIKYLFTGGILDMCICINCLYVHECSTYQNIQKQHGTSFAKNKLLFNPLDPIIHVNISNNSKSLQIDWDITECLSFVDKPGHWVIFL